MKRQLLHTVGFLFTCFLFLYVFAIGIKNFFRYNGFKNEQQRLYEQLDKSTVQNQTYKQELLKMESESYWELKARRRLGLVKKDEHVYKFVYETKGENQ